MTAEFAGLDADVVEVLPFGVDLELFDPVGHPRPSEPGPRVGFFKGFRPVYGPIHLIRAMPLVLKEMPTVRFELVGDGPELKACQSMASKLGVMESIEWIPRQSHQRIPHWLSRWDLTVIPSECEAFGVSALESSAMSVPVIATNVGGLVDTVRRDETGLLVPPKSPEALSEAVVALLGNTRRRLHMGQAGRAWVVKEYDQQCVLNEWIRAYERSLDRAFVMA